MKQGGRIVTHKALTNQRIAVHRRNRMWSGVSNNQNLIVFTRHAYQHIGTRKIGKYRNDRGDFVKKLRIAVTSSSQLGTDSIVPISSPV